MGEKGSTSMVYLAVVRRYKEASQLIVPRLVVLSSRSHSSKAKNGTQNQKLGVFCVLNCEKLSQAGVIRPPVAMI